MGPCDPAFVKLLSVVFVFVSMRNTAMVRALPRTQVINNPMRLVHVGINGYKVIPRVLMESFYWFVFFDVNQAGGALITECYNLFDAPEGWHGLVVTRHEKEYGWGRKEV